MAPAVSVLAAVCLAAGSAWGETPDAPEAEPAVHLERTPASAYREHAPLALFSLGSLAVGGVFYGINASTHRSNVGYTAGDRSQLTSAIGLSGLTALLAAGSYYYYAHKRADYHAQNLAHPHEQKRTDPGAEEDARQSAEAPEWDARLTGGFSPEGDLTLGALLTLPLPSFSR